MRRYLKKKVWDWLRVMQRAVAALKKLISEERFELAYNLIVEMQKGAIYIGTLIDETGKDLEIVRALECFCEGVYKISEKMRMSDTYKIEFQEVENLISEIQYKLINKIPNDKLEVVFLPYKSSMWDSLESIWRTAVLDEECNSYVVPIPYYTRKEDYTFDQLHYEGNQFPKDVPVINYKEFELEKLHPDIVYIHNPYDDGNRVTSIAPQFYSPKIKEHVGILVYVPYAVLYAYKGRELSVPLNVSMGPGAVTADKVVVQSEEHKKLCMRNGFKESKLLQLGSPKMDASIESVLKEKTSAKIQKTGVKTILFNTTINWFLNCNDWIGYVNNVLDAFENKEVRLIWRPHPLLRDTVNSMRPQLKLSYEELVNRMEHMENVIIDDEADVYTSFYVSDALISEKSSIMLQYIATGKPVLNIEECASDKEEKIVLFDYFSNYFVNDGMSIEAFIELVQQEKDEKKEERIKAMKESITNCDGTCGKKVYEACKQEMCFQETRQVEGGSL